MKKESMIKEKFRENEFPIEFTDYLEDLTNNNPLYITAVCSYLTGKGCIKRDEKDVYHLAEKITKDIPRSLNEIIAHYVSTINNDLQEELKWNLQQSRFFTLRNIEKMSDKTKETLVKHLADLKKRYGLNPTKQKEGLEKVLLGIYSFIHTLLKKGVYEKLDKKQRERYHWQTADMLYALYGEDLVKVPEINREYNYHVEIVKDVNHEDPLPLPELLHKEKKDTESIMFAARSKVEAAQQDCEQYDYKKCLSHADKALSLLLYLKELDSEAKEIQFDALCCRYRALSWMGCHKAAHKSAERLLHLAVEQGNKTNISMAYDRLGNAYSELHQYDDAVASFKKALEIDETLNEEDDVAAGYDRIGTVLNYKGEYKEAMKYQRKALAIYERISNLPKVAYTYNKIGSILKIKGDYEGAMEYYKEALIINESFENNERIADSYRFIGSLMRSKEKYDAALDYYEKALIISNQLNDKVRKSIIYTGIGYLLTDKKDYSEAVEYFKKAQKIDERTDDDDGVAMSHINIAATFLKKGYCAKDVMKFIRKAFRIAKTNSNVILMASCYVNTGKVMKEGRKYNLAIEAYKRALGIYKTLNDKTYISGTYNYIGLALKAKGNYEKSVEYLIKALNIDESMNDRSGVATIHHNIAFTLFAKGDIEDALNHMEKAKEIWQFLGHTWKLEEADENIAWIQEGKSKGKSE